MSRSQRPDDSSESAIALLYHTVRGPGKGRPRGTAPRHRAYLAPTMRRLLPTSLLCLSAVVLASCDDSTAPRTDPAAETLAAQIRQMPGIDVIYVYYGDAAASYIFSTGTRADAIRMSSAQLEGTVLTVRTVDQGMYYFALDETKSASISDRLLVLRF
jgi:hypothetical protein